MSGSGVGIWSVGVHLPPLVRTNDWWPADVVARWREQQNRGAEAARGAPPPPTEGARRVLRAMTEQAIDPFQGAVARHVLADDLTSADMEEAAARDAIARAGVDPAEIDLLLTYTAVPEHQVNNSACVVHQRLGLSARCLSLQLEASAYTFLAQLEYAELMIAAGRARAALLVQSCAMSRILDQTDFYSPVFGDGATAVVVGPVASGRGIVRSVRRTESSHPFMLVASVPGGRWYDDGRAVLRSLDLPGARRVFLAIADQAKEVVDAVLERARPDDVRFFASHQGTPWVRRVSQEYAGLAAARSLDAFPDTGTLFAANIPLVLRRAEDRGLLAPDDLTLLFGGGTGVVYGAMLVRWGR